MYRPGDVRFEGKSIEAAVAAALDDPACTMVNRNVGSGTRVLVDQLLKDTRPPGHGVQTKSHNAVAAAIHQGRADWGIAIDTVARGYALAFIPLVSLGRVIGKFLLYYDTPHAFDDEEIQLAVVIAAAVAFAVERGRTEDAARRNEASPGFEPRAAGSTTTAGAARSCCRSRCRCRGQSSCRCVAPPRSRC